MYAQEGEDLSEEKDNGRGASSASSSSSGREAREGMEGLEGGILQVLAEAPLPFLTSPDLIAVREPSSGGAGVVVVGSHTSSALLSFALHTPRTMERLGESGSAACRLERVNARGPKEDQGG